MSDLKPCPFCGPQKDDDREPCLCECRDMKHDYARWYTILCPSCGIEMNDEYLRDLVDRWNCVPPEDETDAAITKAEGSALHASGGEK